MFQGGGAAVQLASASTTDVSTWRAGIDQYRRSKRSLSAMPTTLKPFREGRVEVALAESPDRSHGDRDVMS